MYDRFLKCVSKLIKVRVIVFIHLLGLLTKQNKYESFRIHFHLFGSKILGLDFFHALFDPALVIFK